MYTHTLLTGRLVPNSPAELCNQLYVYDELLAVNGKDVSQVDHDDIVTLVKSSGTSIKLAVQQPEGELHRCVHTYIMCNDLPIWLRYITLIIIQLIFLQQYFPILVPCNITRYCTVRVLLHGPWGYAVS